MPPLDQTLCLLTVVEPANKSARLDDNDEGGPELPPPPSKYEGLSDRQREIQMYIDEHDIRSGVSLTRLSVR